MTGSHITEEQTFNFRRSDLYELLNVTAYKPHEDYLSQNYNLDFLDNFHNWNESPNVTNDTNSGANIAEANIVNQEHQNYYDQRDQH